MNIGRFSAGVGALLWCLFDGKYLVLRRSGLPEDHWLGKVIRRAEAIRALLPSELLEYYRVQGFEL